MKTFPQVIFLDNPPNHFLLGTICGSEVHKSALDTETMTAVGFNNFLFVCRHFPKW